MRTFLLILFLKLLRKRLRAINESRSQKRKVIANVLLYKYWLVVIT